MKNFLSIAALILVYSFSANAQNNVTTTSPSTKNVAKYKANKKAKEENKTSNSADKASDDDSEIIVQKPSSAVLDAAPAPKVEPQIIKKF